MKAFLRRHMPRVASMAFALGLIGTIGSTCRSILYQPKIPLRLLDMDE